MTTHLSSIPCGASLPGRDRQLAFDQLALIELSDTMIRMPKPKTAQRWASQAPKGFSWTLRAWQYVTHPADDAAYNHLPKTQRPVDAGGFAWNDTVRNAYERTQRVAEALAAKVIVFETPHSFTPTLANKNQLAHFFERVDRPRACQLAWDPRGVWNKQEIEAVCRDLTLVRVGDPLSELEEAPIPANYCKLRAPYYNDDQLSRLVDLTSAHPSAFIVFASGAPVSDALRFASLCS